PEGDCVVRAIAIATEKPYAEVRKALLARVARYARQYPRSRHADAIKRSKKGGYNEQPVFCGYLKSLGWQHIKPKEDAYLRADMLPGGRLVGLVSRHAVAVIDGVIHDNWDSGGRSGRVRVESYWRAAS